MTKNQLSPDLDLLFKTLCGRVLNSGEYHKLSNLDLNTISSFLINYNPAFSSSRESLNKSLQNWMQGKNMPSAGKLEEIAKSLGFEGYHDFIFQNKRKIKTNQLRQATTLNPFQKTLIIGSLLLLLAWAFPMISNIPVQEVNARPGDGGQLLASVIQAVVVILFYMMTRFSDFGGRDKIHQISSDKPPEVQRALLQFFKGWKNLWLSFSILYIWFCILYGTDLHTNIYAKSISDIITILSSLCLAYLFSVMDVKSIPRSSDKNSLQTFYVYLIVFTLGLCFSSIISILDRYYHLGFLDGVGTYILGYANVIVMLYFFGRLESHYLNINRIVLLPLYTYAIIQIAYVLFFEVKDGEQSFEAYIIGAVLILKGFLYFLIREWIKERKMEVYFLKQFERLKGKG